MDFLDKSDPYVKIVMGGEEVARTHVVKGSQNPAWDYKAMIDWDGQSDLIFSVWDSDSITPDDWIGQFQMEAGDVKDFQGTVPLEMGIKARANTTTDFGQMMIRTW
eukprot:CAMPEP_0172679176 /NCGR_PEP_ID=MMETSP1074-20121228/15892_1 /TAXON_ID=2916 /ORGANISM="Ceratium fusus, Strain PA161109" /LENGTH=105 /DNA_ID=CAMNT_0013497311 /DNA_START=99 /DNA_END=413 /DNA_ORIENTATION=-